MASPPQPVGRPDARTESVEDLVVKVLQGNVRIPAFQRPLTWDRKTVVELFDSVYRGFPIGSLLLRQGPAEAAAIAIGPMTVIGTGRPDALWVVDGQQRLTSLAVALGRALPIPSAPADPFAVYFDAATETFHSPPKQGDVPTTWVPLPLLRDATELSEWIHSWADGRDAQLRGRVFEAGKRLREYRVPLYVIDTNDEELLRTIYLRVNNNGKPLTWEQVHDGLFARKGRAPSTLAELAVELEKVGMGRPSEDEQLLPALMAYRGLDVTRSFREHLRDDPKVLEGIAAAAEPTLREVLGFLGNDCEIPHLRLLPYSIPLVVLTRFFKEHPQPNPRARALLSRWVWRMLLGAERDDRVLRRGGVAAITSDEEASVQAMLDLVDRTPGTIVVPDAFDARSARSRLVLLAMTSLKPQRLDGAGAVDVAAAISQHGIDAFRLLFPAKGAATSNAANRVLLPGDGSAAADLRAFIVAHGTDHPILRSHAIEPDVAGALHDRDVETALTRRADLLARAVERMGNRLAAWRRGDRPSLDYLLSRAASP